MEVDAKCQSVPLLSRHFIRNVILQDEIKGSTCVGFILWGPQVWSKCHASPSETYFSSHPPPVQTLTFLYAWDCCTRRRVGGKWNESIILRSLYSAYSLAHFGAALPAESDGNNSVARAGPEVNLCFHLSYCGSQSIAVTLLSWPDYEEIVVNKLINVPESSRRVGSALGVHIEHQESYVGASPLLRRRGVPST